MLLWFRERRRRKIMQRPFADSRRRMLEASVPWYSKLSGAEKSRLEGLIQVFLSEIRIEGALGFEVTDAVRVRIAADACRLVLNLSFEILGEMETILVYPSEMRRPKSLFGVPTADGELNDVETPLVGEAVHGGPVLLSWDAVTGGAVHPENGLNVIIHEVAHKIDMGTGDANGVPPLKHRAAYQTWSEICGREYWHLVRRTNRGLESFFDDYAAEHPAEFFAVVCEYFFERSTEMKRKRPALYGLFADFFKQDPAARET